MKFTNLRFAFILLLFFASCEKDDTTSIPQNQDQDHDAAAFAQNFGNEISRNFLGTIVDSNSNPIENVMISIGSSTAMTDSNGVFIINNATINQRFGYVKAEKVGYIHASRAVVPSSGTNKVRITMLPETIAGTTSSGNQETISLPNGSKVALEGDYIKPDGTAYSGSVNVIMHHLDPVDEDMPNQMPGMLYAANSQNEERMLQTFGMLAVELRGDNGEDLNLAEGSTAEITVPLDASLVATAPSTIPLWYFDETNGYWIEEGEATLVGNSYVGTVSHFSFWNVDLPVETVTFCTTITDLDENPLDNLIVQITSATYGTTAAFTNENGVVCGYIPSNETLELNVYSLNFCNTEPLYTSSIGPFSEDNSLDITADVTSEVISETIVGNFITCDSSPVTNGYVKITSGDQVTYYQVSDGTFEVNVLRCPGFIAFELQAVDLENLEMADPQTIEFTTPLTNLGTVQACSELNFEYIQYQLGDGETTTLPIDFAGFNGDGDLSISYSSPNFGGPQFSMRINEYTNPGNYPGDLGQGDLSSSEPFAKLFINSSFGFDGIATVSNVGAIGEYISISFSGTLMSQNTGQESPVSGEIQAIRQQ